MPFLVWKGEIIFLKIKSNLLVNETRQTHRQEEKKGHSLLATRNLTLSQNKENTGKRNFKSV